MGRPLIGGRLRPRNGYLMELFPQKFHHPPQFPEFFLLFYDDSIQVINRFLQIEYTDFKIVDFVLHLFLSRSQPRS